MSSYDCIFCKIVTGEIPSHKIVETNHVLGFMDIGPLSDGHCLFIPKQHAERAHEVPDSALQEILIHVKNVANALGVENYNILQNNGEIAHQAVAHAHWHLIPKPSNDLGLKIQWDPIDGKNQAEIAQKIRDRI
jgi:diadenosine tetraphosphate (Ap4A) HIT family hydrolase